MNLKPSTIARLYEKFTPLMDVIYESAGIIPDHMRTDSTPHWTAYNDLLYQVAERLFHSQWGNMGRVADQENSLTYDMVIVQTIHLLIVSESFLYDWMTENHFANNPITFMEQRQKLGPFCFSPKSSNMDVNAKRLTRLDV